MDAVEEIKARLPVEDVVSQYVELKRSGGSLKGLCPFHQEKTPSFYVTPSKGIYKCFGCGKGGDIFSFLQEIERVSFPDALKQLADQAGVALPEREPKKPSIKNRLYEANEAAQAFFSHALGTAQGERARAYLDQRHFAANAIGLFGIGFAPAGGDALTRQLRSAGFNEHTLLSAGLVRQDDIGGGLRDTFRGRLMFPIRDLSGKIGGFGGRALADSQPKYLNSPQTEIFDKSSVLFGIHLAADSMRKGHKGILVEGYLDAVRAQVEGYENVVASLGTAVTTQQLTALSRLAETVIIALDPDPAGQAAAARATLAALAELTRSRGRATGLASTVDLRIARLPEGLGDPDELIRQAPQRWEEAMEASVPAFEFYFEQTLQGLDRSSESWRQEAIDRLLPPIQQFATSAGWQAIWVQRLAEATGIDPRAIERTMPAGHTPRRRQPANRDRAADDVVSGTTARGLTDDPAAGVELALVGLLLSLIIIPGDALQLLQDAPLRSADCVQILRALLDWQETENHDYELFRETLSADLQARADSLRSGSVPAPEDDKVAVAVEFHLARLRHFQLQAQLDLASKVLTEIPKEDQSEAASHVGQLMAERHDLERKLDRLSKLVLQARSM